MTQPLELSVVLATRNRAELLEQTLAGIAGQLPAAARWEVVVVDNGSTDRSTEVLSAAADRLPLVTLAEPTPGKNRALNQALAVARGELLVFTDDDIIPDSRWLSELQAAAARWPSARVFGGRIVPRMPPGAPEWLTRHPFTEAAYARFELDQAEGPTRKLPFGPNFAVRAEAMRETRFRESIGPEGQNYVSGGEIELLQRLQQQGEEIIYVPTAVVEHVVRPEQLEVDWLLGRSYRLGRCLVELGFVQQGGGLRIAGVPAGVWPRLAREWIHSLQGIGGSDRRRFLTGLDYHFLRGCVDQHRLRRAGAGG